MGERKQEMSNLDRKKSFREKLRFHNIARLLRYNILGANEKLGEPSLPLPHQILKYL